MSKKEEVLEAPVAEEEVIESPEEIEAKQKKAAMASFIMGLIAFLLGGLFGGLLGIILGAIAISKAKKAKGVAVNPSKIFRVLGLVFGILGLIGGILDLIMTVIFVCLLGVGALAGIGYVIWYYVAGPGAQAALALLAL